MSSKKSNGERRVLLSLLSLLLLGSLLGGWFVLRASNKEGKLGSISTARVDVAIGGEPQAGAPAAPSVAPAQVAPTSSAARKSADGRGPSLAVEILGASTGAAGDDDAALAVSAPTGGSQTGAPAPSTSTATTSQGTPTPTQRFVGPTPAERPDPTSTPGNSQTPKTPTAVASNSPSPRAVQPGSATSSGSSQWTDPEALPISLAHVSIPGGAAPGTYTSGGILVTNVGTVAFHYSVNLTLVGDTGFGGQIKLRIYTRQVGVNRCNYQSAVENFVPLIGGDEATRVLYNGAFSAGNLFGNPAIEVATGDRFLVPGQSEVLCIEAIIPLSLGNAFQGATVTGTFVFTAKSPE